MKNKQRLYNGFVQIGMIALVVAAILGMHELLSLLSVGGVGLAMAAGSGSSVVDTAVDTQESASKSPELLRNKISQNITKILPAQAPLDTILRNIGRAEKINSWKYEWPEVEVRGVSDTLKSAFDTSASGTYDSTNAAHTVYVNNVHIWQVDDNILFRGVAGSDGGDLVANVISKNTSTSALTVITLNGLGANANEMPDMDSGQKVTRIGNAKSEKDAKTNPYATMPGTLYNYMQIHMAQVDESFYQKSHLKEYNWDINDMKSMAIYDMRRSMEFTSLFGYRKKLYDYEDEDYKYNSHGITRYLSTELEYTEATLGNDRFQGWAKDVFTGNAGSDSRVLFVGKDLMEDLGGVPSIAKQLQDNKTEVKYGIRFKSIESNFGQFLVKYHPLFESVGWEKKGLVLDMNNINVAVWEPMKTRKLDNISSGISKTNSFVLETTFCLGVRYDATHAIIAPSASS